MANEFPEATARPWRIAHKASDYTYIEQASGNFLTVAKVTDVIERDANAQLIVTAVNSYDALREAAEAAQAWIARVSNQYILGADVPHEVMAQLRAALHPQQEQKRR